MTTKDKMRTLATGKSEALATLERVAEISEPDILAAMLARPIEHQIDIDRRELAKRDEGWAQEREREAARAPAATSQADWSGWEAWLAARLATERAFVLECVGTALGQALQKERAAARRELADEIRRLRVEITAADETIAELRRTIAASRSSSAEVIDITPVRRAN